MSGRRTATIAGALAVLVLAGLAWRSVIISDPPPAPSGIPGADQPFPALAFAAAFHQLDSALAPGLRDTLRRTLPDSAARYHMSVGLFVRNEVLSRPAGVQVAEYLAARGVRQRDDASAVLLDAYGDYLRDQPPRIEAALRRLSPAPRGFTPLAADSVRQ